MRFICSFVLFGLALSLGMDIGLQGSPASSEITIAMLTLEA